MGVVARQRSVWVGQVPSGIQQQATATADSYTYGAASQALSEGQAMAAWADLAARQESYGKGAVQDPFVCPPGWLFAPPKGHTCVNQNNVHIAVSQASFCAPNSDFWFMCSILPLWFHLRAPTTGDSTNETANRAVKSYVFEKLPIALRELDLLRGDKGYGWANVKAHVHALARWLGWQTTSHTDPVAEDSLRNIALAVYNAEATPGPKKKPFQIGPSAISIRPTRGGNLPLLVLVGAGIYAALNPTGAMALYRKGAGYASSVWSKVRT